MKFWEAMKCVQEGKRVSHTCFAPNCYILLTNSNICFNNGDPFKVACIPLGDDNWSICQEAHGFHWALEQLKLGNSVRRITWDKTVYVNVNGLWNKTLRMGAASNSLSVCDVIANDWAIYKEYKNE